MNSKKKFLRPRRRHPSHGASCKGVHDVWKLHRPHWQSKIVMHQKVHLPHRSSQTLEVHFCVWSDVCVWALSWKLEVHAEEPSALLLQHLLSICDGIHSYDGLSCHSESTHPRTSWVKARPSWCSWWTSLLKCSSRYQRAQICTWFRICTFQSCWSSCTLAVHHHHHQTKRRPGAPFEVQKLPDSLQLRSRENYSQRSPLSHPQPLSECWSLRS